MSRSRLTTSTLGAILALLIFWAGPASATDYVVNSADDPVLDLDDDVTLREALTAASTDAASGDAAAGDPDGDTIVFDSAVFGGGATITVNPLVGELEIGDDVTIDGETGSGGGTTTVAISGGGVVRPFAIDTGGAPGSSNAATIADLAVQDGTAASLDLAINGLGGLFYVNPGSNLTLDSVGAFDATAATSGGLIYNEGGEITISDSLLSGGTASGDAADEGGGAIYNEGGSLNLGPATVITMNDADGAAGSGGGVFTDGGTLDFDGGSMQTNTAVRAGGAIEVRGSDDASAVSLSDVQVAGNTAGASPGNGGGIHVTAASGSPAGTTVEIDGGEYIANGAAAEGGGVWNDAAATMTVDGTRFDGNTASGAAADQGGGGLFNNGGELTVTGATVTGNSADGAAGSGGGILGDGGTLTVDGGTVALNTAIRAGGGIELTAQNRTSDATITDLALVGNSAGASPGNGGGLHVTDTLGVINPNTLEISGGTVAGNVAAQEGGGLWNDAGSTMTVDGTLIAGNSAGIANAAGDAQGGGGIFGNGGSLVITGAEIAGNIVTGDAGTDDGGGGIFNDGRNSTASLAISDSTIDDNFAGNSLGNGGGILSIGAGVAADAPVAIAATTFSGNTAPRAGGAIEANTSGFLIVRGTLDGNTAGINGGAIHVTGAGTIDAVRSTFSGNLADNEGGGLWNSSSPDASIVLDSSTVSDNSASVGGGLFNDGAEGSISAYNSTVSGNVAETGGAGAFEGGSFLASFSTLTANSAPAGAGVQVAETATATIDNSILAGNEGDDAEGVVTDGGNNVIGGDPMLEPLADNGGPTLTHALQTGSPAVGAGDATACAAAPINSVDQRGTDRPGAGSTACDAGAYELQGQDTTPPEADPQLGTIKKKVILLGKGKKPRRAQPTLKCPSGAEAGCAGTVVLKAETGKRNKLTKVARANYEIAPGDKSKRKIKLTKKGKKILKSRKTGGEAKLKGNGNSSKTTIKLVRKK